MFLNFRENVLKYFKCIDDLNFLLEIEESKIISHVLKFDKLILGFFFLYLVLLNIFSLLLFQRRFISVRKEDFKYLRIALFPLKFFATKLDQVCLFIIYIHKFGKEKLIKRDLNSNVNKKYFKYIVVGSGPSGAITALELQKKFPNEVLIIERGSFYEPVSLKHSGDEIKNMWFRGGPNITYFKENISFASAKCFGGGSEINSGIFHEPDEKFFDKWTSEFKTLDLSINQINKYLQKVKVLVNDISTENVKFEEIFNQISLDKSNESEKLNKFYKDRNNKNSMSKTLLNEYINLGGAVILNREVENLYRKDDKWTLQVNKSGNFEEYSCDYLFLCCGSIFTNSLLLKSRICLNHKKTLRSFKFHPMIKIITKYKNNLQEVNEEVISNQILNKNLDFIIGNASSSVQFLLSSFVKNDKLKNFISESWKKMKIFHLTFSLGRGRIILLPFMKNPILFYFINKKEKRIMNKSFQMFFKSICKTDVEYVIPVCKEFENSENFFLRKKSYNGNHIKGFQLSSVHVLGGVTMGEGKNCIADSYGKIKDYKNLFVNDSSLINTNLLKNPQGTIMSIAYRNIDNFIKNND